jgi:hypothetical protein
MSSDSVTKIQAMHTPEAIQYRLRSGPSHTYLRDFVYGAVDGIVTTFAVVSGVAGAGLPTSILFQRAIEMEKMAAVTGYAFR